jgi:hypothetical protein
MRPLYVAAAGAGVANGLALDFVLQNPWQWWLFAVAVALQIAALAWMKKGGSQPKQRRLRQWCQELFGPVDPRTRLLRFIEEAGELVQSGGLVRTDVDQVMDMVFSRPVGEFGQEVGGVGVTLLLACETHGYDFDTELDREIERIHQPEVMEKCRRRQAEKKAMGL